MHSHIVKQLIGKKFMVATFGWGNFRNVCRSADWIRQKKYPFGFGCYIFELLAAQSFLKRSIERLVASGGRRARARRDYRGAAEGELS